MTGKLFLYRNNQRILGSDGYLAYNKCLSLTSIKALIRDLNAKRSNFPNKIADSFAFCDSRLNEKSGIITI